MTTNAGGAEMSKLGMIKNILLGRAVMYRVDIGVTDEGTKDDWLYINSPDGTLHVKECKINVNGRRLRADKYEIARRLMGQR